MICVVAEWRILCYGSAASRLVSAVKVQHTLQCCISCLKVLQSDLLQALTQSISVCRQWQLYSRQRAGDHLGAAGSSASGVPSSSSKQSMAMRGSAAEEGRAGPSANITPTPPDRFPPPQMCNVIPTSVASLGTMMDAHCVSQLQGCHSRKSVGR